MAEVERSREQAARIAEAGLASDEAALKAARAMELRAVTLSLVRQDAGAPVPAGPQRLAQAALQDAAHRVRHDTEAARVERAAAAAVSVAIDDASAAARAQARAAARSFGTITNSRTLIDRSMVAPTAPRPDRRTRMRRRGHPAFAPRSSARCFSCASRSSTSSSRTSASTSSDFPFAACRRR